MSWKQNEVSFSYVRYHNVPAPSEGWFLDPNMFSLFSLWVLTVCFPEDINDPKAYCFAHCGIHPNKNGKARLCSVFPGSLPRKKHVAKLQWVMWTSLMAYLTEFPLRPKFWNGPWKHSRNTDALPMCLNKHQRHQGCFSGSPSNVPSHGYGPWCHSCGMQRIIWTLLSNSSSQETRQLSPCIYPLKEQSKWSKNTSKK